MEQERSFDSCWVDADKEIVEKKIGSTTFFLRSITVAEQQRIDDTVGLDTDYNTDTKTTTVSMPTDKLRKRMTLIVTAALGCWKKLGREGWDDKRELTEENVQLMKGEVIVELFNEHFNHFRTA